MDQLTPGEAVMIGALDPGVRGLLYGPVEAKLARATPTAWATAHYSRTQVP